jgi:hypothetical protein
MDYRFNISTELSKPNEVPQPEDNKISKIESYNKTRQIALVLINSKNWGKGVKVVLHSLVLKIIQSIQDRIPMRWFLSRKRKEIIFLIPTMD